MPDDRGGPKAALERAFASVGKPKRVVRLYSVPLKGHESTGFTVHHVDGKLMDKPASLMIAHIGDDPGFYLLYLDEESAQLTDTYHESLGRAFEQAQAEFNVRPEEWKDLNEETFE